MASEELQPDLPGIADSWRKPDASVIEALELPWRHLQHLATAPPAVQQHEWSRLGDAGRAENRARQGYSGRFAIELLQNAHDAAVDGGVRGHVAFVVTHRALLVANDGVPFTARRIQSMTRFGSSEKALDRDHRRLIGYKGIGFISVFDLTDRPEIISRGASFCFDRTAARKRIESVLGLSAQSEVVPARYFPLALEERAWQVDAAAVDQLFAAGAATVIRLPFRTGLKAESIADEIRATLAPEVLLFMPAVERLEFRTPSGSFGWSRTESAHGRARLVRLRGDSGDERGWLISNGTARISAAETEALRDDLWADVRRIDVSVAVPWDDGRPRDRGPQRLFSYFPTEDTPGRGLIIHGDFYLNESRRRIEGDGDQGVVSRRVADTAAHLAAGLAQSLAPQGRRLLDVLAPNGSIEGFGHYVSEALDRELRDARIVRPAVGKTALKPTDARVMPGRASVDDQREMIGLLARAEDLAHPADMQGRVARWLAELGSADLPAADVAGRIEPTATNLGYGAFLALLERWLLTLGQPWAAISALKGRRIVQDKSGQWRLPAEVMKPTAETPHLPGALARTELDVPNNALARDLLDRLGIEALTPAVAFRILIDGLLSRRYGRTDDERRGAIDLSWQIWQTSPAAVSGHLGRGAVLVPARAARARPGETWRRADTLYFGRAWSSDGAIEQLYGPFRQPEFLAESPPGLPSAKAQRAEFFKALGVAARPRLRPVSDKLPNYAEWRRQPSVVEALHCYEDRHEWVERRIDGDVIDRLDEILDRIPSDPRQATALMRQLQTESDPFGPPVQIRCGAQQHGGRARPRDAIGYQRWRLDTTPWVPVSGDPLGRKLVKPSQAWVGIARQADYLMVPRAAVPTEDGTKLGFVQADRPKPAAVEAALADLAKAHPDLNMADQEVRESAQSMMRRLERALAGAKPGRSTPPLAARLERVWAWSSEPVVGNLPGMPQFGDLPVLPPGRWIGLRRAYGLRRVSELVIPRMRPTRPLRASGLLPQQQKVELLALLTRLDLPEREIATRLAAVDEKGHQWIVVEWERIDGGASITNQVDFFLDVQRNKAGAVVRATLHRDARRQPNWVELGQTLADYLGVSEQEAEVELFFTSRQALLSSRGVTEAELSEALRTLRGRRWFREAGPEPAPEGSASEAAGAGAAEGQGSASSGEQGEGTTGDRSSTGTSVSQTTGTGAGAAPVPAKVRPLLDASHVSFGESHTAMRRRRGGGSASRLRGSHRTTPTVVNWMAPDGEVELVAMRTAAKYGREVAGAVDVIDVSAQNVGWDIEFRFVDGSWTPVEVKGSAGDGLFVITPNEWRAAQEHRNWLLMHVINIRAPSRAAIRIYHDFGEQVDDDLLSGLSWAVTGWDALDPEEVPLNMT